MNPDITPEELKPRLNNKEELLFIDVREEWEFEEKNIGARLIPLSSLPSKLEELARYKNQEIVVHCKSGNRSNQARMYLVSKGFSNVRSLVGGMEAFLG